MTFNLKVIIHSLQTELPSIKVSDNKYSQERQHDIYDHNNSLSEV